MNLYRTSIKLFCVLLILGNLAANAAVRVDFELKLESSYAKRTKDVLLCGNRTPLGWYFKDGQYMTKNNDSTYHAVFYFHDSLKGKELVFYHFLIPKASSVEKEALQHKVILTQTGNDSLSVAYNTPDFSLDLETEHFLFFAPDETSQTIKELADTLEKNYKRITGRLSLTLSHKIKVMVYKDLQTYHNAIGYPNLEDWVVGNAVDSMFIHMVSPDNPGPAHNKPSLLRVIVHEFTHNCISALANGSAVPVWLNEGTALHMARQELQVQTARNLYNQLGRLRTLSELEQDFSGNNGYQWGESIAKFITRKFGDSTLAAFIQNPQNYSLLQAQNKSQFESDWHKFVHDHYLTDSPEMVNVTFRVDLQQYSGSFSKVHINGSFNDWCGSCDEMKDLDGDKVYELTVKLEKGQKVYWLFTLDGWAVSEVFAEGASCTETNGIYTNRVDSVEGEIILPAFCWNYCEPCSTGGVFDLRGSFNIYPNPCQGELTVEHPDCADVSLILYSQSSEVIKKVKSFGSETVVLLPSVEKGVYYLQVQSGQQVIVKQVLVL